MIVYGLLALFGALCEAAIVPPPWADPGNNPCASQPGGWQLLYWPGDGKCYKIFHRGAPPCPPTKELTPGANRTAECRCPPGSAQRADDGLCYPLYATDPCPPGQYFAPLHQAEGAERWGACQEAPACLQPGDLFYPRDGRCHPAFSQGPCPRGQLLAPAREQGVLGECRCDENGRLGRYYWPGSGTCHPHYTPGPCLERGALFLPGGKCGCHAGLPQYHPQTTLCYQLGTVGPCPAGHHFSLPNNTSALNNTTLTGVVHAKCRCKPGHVRWAPDGACYRPFTRGPCPHGEMFSVGVQDGNKTAQCVPLPCLPGRLFFPGGKGCHRVGTRGPCPPGQVVLFQESVKTSVEGVSYQGMCGCATQSHDGRSFYPTLRADERSSKQGGCLPQSRKDDNTLDIYQEDARSLPSTSVDRCAAKRGFITWPDGSCQQLYTQGPCKPGQWVVPDHAKGRRRGRGSSWRQGKCECLPGYTTAVDATGHTTCLPPAVTLAHYLNTHADTQPTT